MPSGWKLSRALWDRTQRHTATSNNKNGSLRDCLQIVKSWMQAILYELQPIRYSQFQRMIHQNTTTIVPTVQQFTTNLVQDQIPSIVSTVVQFLRNRSCQQWLLVLAVVVYYWFVRYMHEYLEAGPVVLIITVLIMIGTIGLGDTNTDGISAYSVFNRGMRLLGDIQVDDLLAQHVGGFMGGGGGGRRIDDDDDDRNILQEPVQRRRGGGGAGGGAGVDQQQQQPQQNNDQVNPAANAVQRRRLPGKKARRRNLEQRREMQRQRRLAAEAGLVWDNVDWDEYDDDGNNNNNELAMQQLLLDQVGRD